MNAPPIDAPTTVDIVVVGGGGAGLAAAVTAAEFGASVIVLEKNARLGGTTALAVGSFTAAGTSMQRAAGVIDSEELFGREMALSNGELEHRDDEVLREVLTRHAGASFEWLRSLGLQFIGPTAEPPFSKPRMHNIVPNSRAYITRLERTARRRGVVIRTQFRVQRLLRNDDGCVIGIDGPCRVTARRGVILATGDFSASGELKARWLGPARSAMPPVNPSSTGDGFIMAMELGAAVKNVDRALEDLRLPPPSRAAAGLVGRLPTSPYLARPLRVAIERLPRKIVSRVVRAVLTGHVAPSQALFEAGAILVNAEGHRFANERDTPARALAAQRRNTCHVVFDATIARRFSAWPHPLSTFPGVAYAYLGDYERYRPDAIHRSASMSDLARRIGLDPIVLEKTVGRYNLAVHNGSDIDFDRPALAKPIVEPPFYALGPLTGHVTITDGGLALDQRCRVLDCDGVPIPRLFAAGSTGQGGLILRNHGLHIAWAFTSGRVAAASALNIEMDIDTKDGDPYT